MTSKNSDPATSRYGFELKIVIAALVWLIGFNAWFHHFTLPNNHVPRWQIWQLVPYDLMDLVDPVRKPGELPWGWLYLGQRLPYLAVAIAVWSGAWATGSLMLRSMQLRLRGAEGLFFSLCVGMSLVSLEMLLIGVSGLMSRGLLLAALVCPLIAELRLRRRRSPLPIVSERPGSAETTDFDRHPWMTRLLFAAIATFVACQLLGAMSPQIDFDVVEYHLCGPKEWFQQGRISRLPHNVYTSFPFLTEMLVLSGMVLCGDWQWGALAGQAVIAGFAPLTALGLFAAGSRWFSKPVAWLAALVYVTSPWTYRISIIAYAEGGLSCFLFAALYAGLLFRLRLIDPGESSGCPKAFAILSGLVAGSAMACKYTGLVMVVVPIGALIFVTSLWYHTTDRWPKTVVVCLWFMSGTLTTIGPWLLKNGIETGNPVYPLGVRYLGGVDRTRALDEKWQKAHAAKSYSSWFQRLNDLRLKLEDVAANNDWHSPLMFGLAPLSLVWLYRKRRSSTRDDDRSRQSQQLLIIVWLYVVWQFVVWFCFTHHIDRFYVPMFSVVALLAGVGGRWWDTVEAQSVGSAVLNFGMWFTRAIILVSLPYNADLMAHELISGFNAGRMDLIAAQQMAERIVSQRLSWLNTEFESGQLPPNFKVLCVGEAQLFHARFPYLYNTVFDHSILEQICVDPAGDGRQLRPAAEIRDEFHRRGITHIDVSWSMILMYREPYNYGYTEFVNPDLFAELQRMGILGPPMDVPKEYSLAPLSDQRRELMRELKWGSSLIKQISGSSYYFTAQLYPVIQTDQ